VAQSPSKCRAEDVVGEQVSDWKEGSGRAWKAKWKECGGVAYQRHRRRGGKLPLLCAAPHRERAARRVAAGRGRASLTARTRGMTGAWVPGIPAGGASGIDVINGEK